MKNFTNLRKQQDGYVLLISVLVLSAASLALAIAGITLGLNFTTSSSLYRQARAATAMAHTCGEQALEKLKENANYTGPETLTFPGSETCTVVSVTGSGAVRTIKSQGSAQGAVARVQIEVSQVSPQIIVSSWKELADFQ